MRACVAALLQVRLKREVLDEEMRGAAAAGVPAISGEQWYTQTVRGGAGSGGGGGRGQGRWIPPGRRDVPTSRLRYILVQPIVHARIARLAPEAVRQRAAQRWCQLVLHACMHALGAFHS